MTVTTTTTTPCGDDTELDMDIARLGNGNGQDILKEQRDLIDVLYDRVAPLLRNKLPNDDDKDFCDHETCRRYLVARQWNLSKAEAQLSATIKWRLQEQPAQLEFWQSPKPMQDPLALSMRVIGVDQAGRPIAYTCFAEAHDRFDVDANLTHMTLLMEACCQLIRQRRARGLNQTAESRQWVWIVDFDGFGFRDTNPKSSIMVAKLMAHYPEMLYMAVLMNAPALFSGVYRLITPILDERVRNKILFLKGVEEIETLKDRLGKEATNWVLSETQDNQEKRPGVKTGNPKQYWVGPTAEGDHDARGMDSYVGSYLYIKTPGDAFMERSREN